MRIGIIRDTKFTNEPRGQNIARVLIAQGHQVYVLCYGESNTIETYHKMTLERFYLNPMVKKKFSSLIETVPLYKYLWVNKIKNFIKKYNIQVLQVHDLYMLGAAHIANKKYNLPIVANFHENYPAAVMSYNWARSKLGKLITRPQIWRKLQGKYLRKTDKVIVTCKEYREKLLEYYKFLSPDDVIVYINVPDLAEFSSYHINEKIFDKDQNYILFYFGVNAERRGLFTCFEALEILKNKISNIKLLLIGPVDKADRQRFDSYMNNPQLANDIIFYHWKDISLIPSYIKISDICLSPLLYNEHHNTTIANKIFQYMLYEKPIVVSDCLPQQRIVNETGCGLLHKAGSAADLAAKIYQLYQNPKVSKEMGTKGKQAVFEKYNTTAQGADIIKLYAQVEKQLMNEREIASKRRGNEQGNANM